MQDNIATDSLYTGDTDVSENEVGDSVFYDETETNELINNIFFHGGAALVYAYEGSVQNETSNDKLKSKILPDEPHKKEKLYQLGFENDLRNLEGIQLFRKSIYPLPRSIRYLVVDIKNNMGSSINQLYMHNSVMMVPGMVTLFYTGITFYNL